MKMRYSIDPRDRIYVKGYGFLSFAKNIGKNLSNRYGQKLLDSAKKSTMDAIKTASKRAIKKTAEAAGDLIGNKIADRIKKYLQRNCIQPSCARKNYKMTKWKHQKKGTYFQKKGNKLLMN